MEQEGEAEIIDRDADWSKFLKSRYKKQLSELSREYPYRKSIIIDYRELESFGKTGLRMADELLENPGKVIEDVKSAVTTHQLIKTKDGKAAKDINIRFINLPKKIAIRQIRSDHINTFISVEGILRKTTEVRPRIVEAYFRCPGGHITVREQGYGKFREPDGCVVDGCTFKKLELVPKRSRFVDSQKLRIQESPEGLRGGEQPQTLDVDATDDLTGRVAPGDRVIINGILRSVQRISHGERSTIFEIYLECNSIEIAEKEFEEVQIEEKDEEEILTLSRDPNVYRKITHSIAPTIYGNEDVKEAIALQLFGGITKEMPMGVTCGETSISS
jgi:replicative DNA helicase Mcm